MAEINEAEINGDLLAIRRAAGGRWLALNDSSVEPRRTKAREAPRTAAALPHPRWRQGLRHRFGGSPRCRRSVAQTYLVLHPLRAVGWRRVLTAGRSPPMPARFCSGRPTASSTWLGALQAASWMRAGRT